MTFHAHQSKHLQLPSSTIEGGVGEKKPQKSPIVNGTFVKRLSSRNELAIFFPHLLENCSQSFIPLPQLKNVSSWRARPEGTEERKTLLSFSPPYWTKACTSIVFLFTIGSWMIRTGLSPYTGFRRHSDNSSLMDSTLFNIPFSCIRRPLVYISLVMRTSYYALLTEDTEKVF